MQRQRKGHACARDAGFTLAEMLVAIAILFFALTALLALMVSSAQTGASAKVRTTMVNAANSYVERARGMSFDSVTAASLVATDVVVNGVTVHIEPTVSWVDDPAISGSDNYKSVAMVLTATGAGRPPITMSIDALIRPEGQVTTTKPKIEFASGSPSSNAVVANSTVFVGANATAVGAGATLASVNFYVDGVPMHSTTGVAQWPVSTVSAFKWISWDTRLLNEDGVPRSPDGLRTLKIEAWDSNQRSVSRTRQVLVDNYPPSQVSGLTATSPTPTSVKLEWSPTTDGTELTDHYRFSTFRLQPLTPTSVGDSSGWTRVTGTGFTTQLSPTTVSVQPLSRYNFRVRAASPRGLEAVNPDADAVVVTRPAMSGTFANTKSGSNYTGTQTLTVPGPTFDCAPAQCTLLRSTSAAMTSPTQFTMTWNSGTRQWTYTTPPATAKSGSPQYYYQAVVTVTPYGYPSASNAPVTVSSGVYGPNHPTTASGTLPFVRW